MLFIKVQLSSFPTHYSRLEDKKYGNNIKKWGWFLKTLDGKVAALIRSEFMKKIDDWFIAGLYAGIVGGAALNLYCAGLILLGVPFDPYWKAVGGLFYNKQLLSSWLAQVHGVIDPIGVSGANGILTCSVIKMVGKRYFYIKSVVLSALSAYFLFLVVYPQTGLGKNNPYTPWVALSGHTVFLGLLTGYILKKIYSFDRKPTAKTTSTIGNNLLLEINELKSETPVVVNDNISSKKKSRFLKPKKL